MGTAEAFERRGRADEPQPWDAPQKPVWGSDLVVATLRGLGIDLISLNPGSTFRGIHDSLVNFGGNARPEIILVNHEMIGASLARGYARATGRPMATIVHDHVGLLNASMTIYDAWCDRVPMLILAGSGPSDAVRRRPWIDWLHAATDQGALVREFTKWDDQPGSIAAIPESLARAHRIAVTEPCGPTFVGIDVALQELPVPADLRLPELQRYRAPATPVVPAAELDELARWLIAAELPVLCADRTGARSEAVDQLVALAETLAAPVLDFGARHNFPTHHELAFWGDQARLLADADVAVGFDMTDPAGAFSPTSRACRIASISMDDYAHRGQSADYQSLPMVDLPMLGTSTHALRHLVEVVRSRLAGADRERIEARRLALTPARQRLHLANHEFLSRELRRPALTEAALMVALWDVIKDDDFVFVYGPYRRMAPGVVRIDSSAQSLGWGAGGGAVGAAPGVAVGAALALRDAGHVPIAILGDGETLASIQVLWTAAHYQVPLLMVINNNRTYLNDEAHQIEVARARQRPVDNAWIGQRIEEPSPDFVGIARAFDVHGEGPVWEPSDLSRAFGSALDRVRRGQPALVDVRTAHRGGR